MNPVPAARHYSPIDRLVGSIDQALRTLLGGNSAARLPLRVREKEGLSYSTYAFFSASSLDPTATFGVGAIFAPENKKRVESAIQEELKRALDAGFTESEFENAKRGLLESRRIARAQDGSLLGRIANYAYLGRTFAWDIDFEKRIQALTPAQVREALHRHIDPARLSVMKAGDFRLP